MRIKSITEAGLGAAVITVMAWTAVPAAVPFTLQTLAIFLVCGILGAKKGLMSVCVYILLGAVGLPVFSGFRGGVGALLGVTGGYITGFVFIPLLMLIIKNKSTVMTVLSMVSGLIVCYMFGTAWFMLLYTQNGNAVTLSGALSMCVLPFVIPDIAKLILAVFITDRVRKFRP